MSSEALSWFPPLTNGICDPGTINDNGINELLSPCLKYSACRYTATSVAGTLLRILFG